MEIFARSIPPEQQDWISKSATIISHAITGSTTLLLAAISAGSSFYISHSKPSASRVASSSSTTSSSPAPPPLPPRAVAFLSSARTRKGLAAVHSVSGQAVKVSAKTVAIIDGMIKRAVGSSKGRGRSPQGMATLSPAKPPLPPRTPSPASTSSSSYLAPPPPYTSSPNDKPPLPPRRQPSPSPTRPPALPPRRSSERVALKLSKKARILLSADLIWSTIDNSTKRILDSGKDNLGAVVGHKYGPEAAESSLLMAGTAQNLALVYIDMRGLGRRAILRRVGKEFVKGRVSHS